MGERRKKQYKVLAECLTLNNVEILLLTGVLEIYH